MATSPRCQTSSRGPTVSLQRATIAWSWSTLDPVEQRALAESTIFAGGFTLEAAEEILLADADCWVGDVLESLVEKSLLRRVRSRDEQTSPRFDLFETIRAFAGENLGQDAREALEDRHARYYTELLESIDVYRHADAEGENILSAAWNVVDRHPNLAARAAMAAYLLLRNRGAYRRIYETVDRVLDELDRLDDPDLTATLYGVCARCLMAAGHYRRGRAADRRGLAESPSPADTRTETFLRGLKGRGLTGLGRPAEARSALLDARENLPEIDEVGRPYVRVTLDHRIASRSFEIGEFDAARQRLYETIEYGRTDEASEVAADRTAVSLETMARFARKFGELDRAERLLDRALDRHPAVTRDFEVRIAAERGHIAFDRGERERAESCFRDALRTGDRRARIPAHFGLARFAGTATDSDPKPHLDAILEIVAGTDDRPDHVQAATWLGVAHLGEAAYRAADDLFERATDLAADLEAARSTAHITSWRALAHAGRGSETDAKIWLEQSRAGLEEADAAREMIADVDNFFRPVARLLWAETPPNGDAPDELSGELERAAGRRRYRPATRIWTWHGWHHLRQLTLLLQTHRERLADADPDSALRVAPDGDRFIVPDGPETDLRNRQSLPRILAALADRRDTDPGAGLEVDRLVDIGWPDAVLTEDAGRNRAYNAIRQLRDAGLDDLLVTGSSGYYLDPDTPFLWLDDDTP